MADPDNKDGLNIEDFINMMRELGLIPDQETNGKKGCGFAEGSLLHDIKHKEFEKNKKDEQK